MFLSIFGYSWRRILGKPRFYLVLIATLFYIANISAPLSKYAQLIDEPVSPWLLPVYFGNPNITLILFLLVVLLFCDAPFLENTECFIILRSGRNNWLCAQLLYIVSLSAFYTIYLALVSILTVVTNAAIMPEWGKLLYSLANTNAGDMVELQIHISPIILNRYTAVQAMGIELLITFLVTFLLGSVMFCVNLAIHRTVGSVIGALFVLEQFLASNSSGYVFYYLSPVSWINLRNLNISGVGATPTLFYIIYAILTVSTCCWFISFFAFRRRNINILQSI